MSSDETRRVDETGYVQHKRDPRLNPSPAAQQRPAARPAPQHLALPQHDGTHDYDSDADHGQDYEAPPAPPAPRAPVQKREAATPAPARQPDNGVIELSRAYEVHGEPLKRFTMRKPVAREIGKIGNPLKFDISEDGRITEVEARWDRVMKYITALSNPQIPPSIVEQFEYEDLDACAAFLGPFFLKVMKLTD